MPGKFRYRRDPQHVESQPVEREAYIELMKSLARLNALRKAKKERLLQIRSIVRECYQCHEILEDSTIKSNHALCPDCREMNRKAHFHRANEANKEKRRKARKAKKKK